MRKLTNLTEEIESFITGNIANFSFHEWSLKPFWLTCNPAYFDRCMKTMRIEEIDETFVLEVHISTFNTQKVAPDIYETSEFTELEHNSINFVSSIDIKKMESGIETNTNLRLDEIRFSKRHPDSPVTGFLNIKLKTLVERKQLFLQKLHLSWSGFVLIRKKRSNTTIIPFLLIESMNQFQMPIDSLYDLAPF